MNSKESLLRAAPFVLAAALLSRSAALPAAAACPFCKSLQPTLAQQRQASRVTALGELTQEGASPQQVLVHHVLKGAGRLKPGEKLPPPPDLRAKPGTLLVLFGDKSDSDKSDSDQSDGDRLVWRAVVVNETSYAYVARAPAMRIPTAKRLAYFSGSLEHAEDLIAEDAYQEFGHAPYEDVRQVAGRFSANHLRDWLLDGEVPEERKGFYGLMLGLAPDPSERGATSNAAFLRRLIEKPADDFRGGFDGILGGYLVATGEKGLAFLEQRYLANPKAAVGDVRHVLAALRFYKQSGEEISANRLNEALHKVLDRPEFAAEAITDLARWRDWSTLDRIASLYDRESYAQPDTHLAIVGYLLVCPKPKAAESLERIRRLDPEGVAAAEEQLSALGADQ